MTLQEQFTNGERASNDLAEEHSTTAAVEHCVYGVIGGAIRTKTQRWRAIDWINRGPRPEGATGNNRRCERRCDRNVQAHSGAKLQQPRNERETFTREIRS